MFHMLSDRQMLDETACTQNKRGTGLMGIDKSLDVRKET